MAASGFCSGVALPKVAQIQMIIWTFVAVVVTGFAVAFSLLTPPSSVTLAKTKAVQQAALVEPLDRSPASVELEFSARPIDDQGQQALDFTLPCEGKTKFAANVVQVRLSGSVCGKVSKKSPLREIASSEISNAANGFSATVFYPNAKSFTTDYMTLVPGENRIRILHVFKQGGKETRDYIIERARK
jgi:hypothetical protein